MLDLIDEQYIDVLFRFFRIGRYGSGRKKGPFNYITEFLDKENIPYELLKNKNFRFTIGIKLDAFGEKFYGFNHNELDITWREIYKKWSEKYKAAMPETLICEVERPGVASNGDEYYDLWNKNDVTQRIESLKRWEKFAPRQWSTPVGHQETSELLWMTKENEELYTAALMAGTLWSAMNKNNRKENIRFSDKIYYTLTKELPFRWGHLTKEGIPFSYIRYLHFKDKKFKTDSFENFLKWLFDEISFFAEHYVLVKIKFK